MNTNELMGLSQTPVSRMQDYERRDYDFLKRFLANVIDSKTSHKWEIQKMEDFADYDALLFCDGIPVRAFEIKMRAEDKLTRYREQMVEIDKSNRQPENAFFFYYSEDEKYVYLLSNDYLKSLAHQGKIPSKLHCAWASTVNHSKGKWDKPSYMVDRKYWTVFERIDNNYVKIEQNEE